MAHAESEPVEFQRRLDTPSRETLVAHYDRTEALSRLILGIEAAVGLAALGWILSRASAPFGPLPWIAAAMAGLGVFRWYVHQVFLNKKRLEDIRPDVRFGVHNRDSLLATTRGVFERLGLKPGSAPVFLTREKDVNAHAVRCELWPGMHLFNGVYLNRAIIHLLDEAELASVIGHELGHVFPYAPILSRTYIVHSLAAGAVSFALAVAFPYAGVALIGPLLLLWVLDRVIAFPHLRLSRGIEFLCDDIGARAAGLLPALSSEVKIAVEMETRQMLLLKALQARANGTAGDVRDLVAAYDAAIPFGKADPEAFERDLSAATREQRRSDGQVSAAGFFRFLQAGDNRDASDWIEEQTDVLRALDQVPLALPDRSAYLRGSRAWTLPLAENLARTLEASPGAIFVRLPEEIDDRSASHPCVSRRILFLWRALGN